MNFNYFSFSKGLNFVCKNVTIILSEQQNILVLIRLCRLVCTIAICKPGLKFRVIEGFDTKNLSSCVTLYLLVSFTDNILQTVWTQIMPNLH